MRRIESIGVPAETRKLLRDRLQRFLPSHGASFGRLNTAVRPPVFDAELVDFYRNLVFLSGDQVSRAREAYELARDALLKSREQDSPNVDDEAVEFELSPTVAGTTRENPVSFLSDATASAQGNTPEAGSIDTNNGASGDETQDDSESPPPGVTSKIISNPLSLTALSPPPAFDELVTQGWIYIAWDRVVVPGNILRTVLRSQEAMAAPIRAIIEARGLEGYAFSKDFVPSESLREFANDVVAGRRAPSEIASISQAWIAARIWDTPPHAPGTSREDLELHVKHWVNCWRSLGAPSFSLTQILESNEVDFFVNTALDVLTRPSVSPSWEELRVFAAAPMRLMQPHRVNEIDARLPTEPTSTVARFRWMEGHAMRHAFGDFAVTESNSLMAVLTNELRESPFVRGAWATRLLDLIVERPILLVQLGMVATSTPVILADMLMSGSTCPLACLLIARWDYNGGGWNRSYQIHANQTAEVFAFEDALAMLASHIEAAQIPAYELAALYYEIYKLSLNPKQASRRREVLSLLRSELSAADPTFKSEVLRTLVTSAHTEMYPTEAFCAALDMATEGDVADLVDPSDLVTLYLDVVLPKAAQLHFGQLDPSSSRLLCELALRCETHVRDRFLGAIDVQRWLRENPPDTGERYIFRDQLIRRIRLHIHLLARAIAAWPSAIPRELVSGLCAAIHAGAIDRSERNRLDAFNVTLTTGILGSNQPSISLDLAAALRRVEGNLLQSLVAELCQVEEPVVLAEIVANTPASHNGLIVSRLRTLTPETSSSVWGLPAIQARVNALLATGLIETAEAFIAEERNAVTLGKVQGREVARIRVDLGLLVARSDWGGLSTYALPVDLTPAERNDASDALDFYRALAELKKERGDFAGAEATFTRLSQRHPTVIAYAINAFVSSVHRLLNDNVFLVLAGNDLAEAKRILSDAERDVMPLIQHSTRDLKPFNVNRIMLKLGAGQTREALELSLQMRETGYDAHVEGFAAVAMARLGSRREAITALTEVQRVFGRTEFLAAVRENIDTHRPYSTVPNLTVDGDPIPSLRHAFEALARLGHDEQAQVLQERGRIDLYLLEQVRGACASLVAVAPMMENLEMLRLEDNISGVLKQLLLSRLVVPQWAVQDQPRGGRARSGGVGERDIVISKGTAELAVIEALVVKSVDTTNLTLHFEKLFDYGSCRFFFHITYSRGANRTRIVSFLKEACAKPPSGISYQDVEDLPDHDSSPIGFKAFYTVDSREIIMTFLVLDMGRPSRDDVAATQ